MILRLRAVEALTGISRATIYRMVHDYLPEMRLALQRWADHLDRLVSGDVAGSVVAFR